MDDLWHCHVLCTQRYQEFMKLVASVNPMVDFIHHSLLLGFSSVEEKLKRREATSQAYRKIFGKDCSWLSEKMESTPVVTPILGKRKQQAVQHYFLWVYLGGTS